MTIQEFESRTGFYPDHALYSCIAEAYMESNLDKDAFCEAYKNNENGMAEAIARKASTAAVVIGSEVSMKIFKLEKRVEFLKAQLKRAQDGSR